ncbi:NifU family protein [Candidatus Nomurabacteria bacterium]|nr:NifU family protein [Candidatus Nomurabacteria bacterium]
MEKLEKIIEDLKPALQSDGGDIELVKYDQEAGVVEVSLKGACAHCPIADFTLKNLVEQEIKSQLPEVKEVRAV